jgi:hypothetical protein
MHGEVEGSSVLGEGECTGAQFGHFTAGETSPPPTPRRPSDPQGGGKVNVPARVGD